MTFILADNNKVLIKLAEAINRKIDIYTYLFSEQQKEVINKFKIYIPESKGIKIQNYDLVAAK